MSCVEGCTCPKAEAAARPTAQCCMLTIVHHAHRDVTGLKCQTCKRYIIQTPLSPADRPDEPGESSYYYLASQRLCSPRQQPKYIGRRHISTSLNHYPPGLVGHPPAESTVPRQPWTRSLPGISSPSSTPTRRSQATADPNQGNPIRDPL